MVALRSRQHHVEQNVAQTGGDRRERERDRVPQGGKVEQQTWNDSSLFLLVETKSTKVCACSRGSLPMARRGSNDGRHMGDSPGAQREEPAHLPPLLLALSRSLFVHVPLCGPDFTG